MSYIWSPDRNECVVSKPLACVGVVAAAAAHSVVPSAYATFPGRNGPIAYRQLDPATGVAHRNRPARR